MENKEILHKDYSNYSIEELYRIKDELDNLKKENREYEMDRVITQTHFCNYTIYDNLLTYLVLFGGTTIVSKAFTPSVDSFELVSSILAAVDLGIMSAYNLGVYFHNNDVRERISQIDKSYMHNCKNIKKLEKKMDSILDNIKEYGANYHN